MLQRENVASLLVAGTLLTGCSSAESVQIIQPPETATFIQSSVQEIGVLSVRVGSKGWEQSGKQVPSSFMQAASEGAAHLEKGLRGQQQFKIVNLGSYTAPKQHFKEGERGCVESSANLVRVARGTLGQRAAGRVLAIDTTKVNLCGTVAESSPKYRGFTITDRSAKTFAHELAHIELQVAHQFVVTPLQPIDKNAKTLELKMDTAVPQLCSDNLMGVYCNGNKEPIKDEDVLKDPQPLTSYNLFQAGVIPQSQVARLDRTGTYAVPLRQVDELSKGRVTPGYSLIQVELPWSPQEKVSDPDLGLQAGDTSFAYIDISESLSHTSGVSVHLGGPGAPDITATAFQIKSEVSDDGLLQPGESIEVTHNDHSLKITSAPAQSGQPRVVVDIE